MGGYEVNDDNVWKCSLCCVQRDRRCIAQTPQREPAEWGDSMQLEALTAHIGTPVGKASSSISLSVPHALDAHENGRYEISSHGTDVF